MSNLWKILTFIWANKDMLWAVIQEIMDLFKADESAPAKVYEACKDCSPELKTLSRLGKEADKYNKKA